LPKREFYGLNYAEQVNNQTNDVVYYELGRFVDLLMNNNPNLLELLATPEQFVLHKTPVISLLKPEMFLSKLCSKTFAGYAKSQIHKAKGLNKKIFNPVEEERKTILDFCYIIEGYDAVPLNKWLKSKGFRQEECGLINVPHRNVVQAQSLARNARRSGNRHLIDRNERTDLPVIRFPELAGGRGVREQVVERQKVC
jgi:predicted nucleotidyltransferase